MSKKTNFLKNLFTRVGGDRRQRRDRRSKNHIEQLEGRIALAVDVVLSPEGGGGEQWLTVLANNGSDVSMKMDATPTNDLRIADNSSFFGNIVPVASVDDRFDSIYVYNGNLVDQQVLFPNDTNYSSGFGLLPTSYSEILSNNQELTFLLNSRGLDESDPITGSIQLGDQLGSGFSFRNIDTDADGSYDNVWEIIGSPTPIQVSFGAVGPLRTMRVSSAALAGAGTSAMPILDVEYDYSSFTTSDARYSSRSGVLPSSPTSSFNLFNQTTHEFVPGLLKGEVTIHFAGFDSTPLSFQVETSGLGIVDVSFGRDLSTQYTNLQPRVSVAEFSTPITNNVGGIGFGGNLTLTSLSNERFTIRGQFNTETGELSFTTVIENGSTSTRVGGLVNLPLVVDNLQIGLRDISASDDGVDPLGTRFDDLANDLTLFPGSNFTRSIIAELPNTASEISIESPLIVAAGTNDGRVSLSAGKVSVNSGIRAAGQFVIPGARTTAFGTSTEIVNINAPVGSQSFDIRLDDNELTGNFVRSQFKLSQQGSLSNMANILALPPATLPRASQVYLEVEDGDAFIEGTISANEHSYVMRSEEPDPDSEDPFGSEREGPYFLTTTSNITNVSTGEIIGDTLSMLLANDTFGNAFGTYQIMANTVDLQTSVDRVRMQAATRQGNSADFPFPYDISIRESGNLIVDAVAASSGKIDIEADGSLSFLSSVNSMGDIKLQSGDNFVVSAPVATSFGSIEIRGPQVNVSNSVRIYGGSEDPLKTDILIEATEGQLLIEDAVAAINGVKLSASGNNGKIVGDGRVIGDSVETVSTGDIVIRTDANAVSVRTPGTVRLEDQSAAAFEVFDSPDVTLIANGLDDVVIQANGTKDLSPSLFANVTGATKIAVSAPRGSIDLLHSGTVSVEVGDGVAVAASPEAGVDVMTAAGSVTIRSNSARDMLISDAPSATSGATSVRFTTSQPLPEATTSFTPSSLPGVYPTFLTTALTMDVDKSLDTFGGVDATDIKPGDFILLKDGRVLHSIVSVEQISPTEVKMPESFVADESVINKRIQGSSFAPGTDIVEYDPTTKILQISQPLQGAIDNADIIHILDRSCNGIYGVVGKVYQSSSLLGLTLRRVAGFDTTHEVSGRQYFRITDGAENGNGSTAGKVFVSEGFSNKISTTSVPTPIFVQPVLSRPGFVTANAISTKNIPAQVTPSGDLVATDGGAIGFDADLFDGVVLGVGRRVLIQSPLTDAPYEAASHYGLYTVLSAGRSVEGQELPWRLSRYDGVDENGDGNTNQFHTGTVALTQGSLRTAVTGQMYEIGYDSLNNAALSFREITDFRKVTTETGGTYLTEDFNSTDQYRTDIGTRNVLGTVTYQVSSEGGRNDEPGSLGRILTILQGNTATVDRVGQAQLTETTFHDSVQRIQLEQELPIINSPIKLISNSEISVDGSRINRTRDGAVVRTGSLRARLGPASPSAPASARRLVRGAAEALSFDQVNGFEIAPGGKGSIIGNLSIGGFTNGSGISIVGADNVLLNNVRVGVDVAGNPMPNAVGIKIDQAAGGENARFTTVRNSTIAANTKAGISLGTNVDGVRVVGSVIGLNEAGNEKGVIVDTGESGISRLGVRQISPTAAVVGLPVTPLESYPGDIPGAALPNVYDPAPTSRVSVSKNSATDSFEPGLQLFDRTTNRMWTVRKIELSVDELNYVMTVKGPQIDADSFGTPIALEAGYFVDAPQRAETLRLPPGIDPARLYLGQRSDFYCDRGPRNRDIYNVNYYLASS